MATKSPALRSSSPWRFTMLIPSVCWWASSVKYCTWLSTFNSSKHYKGFVFSIPCSAACHCLLFNLLSKQSGFASCGQLWSQVSSFWQKTKLFASSTQANCWNNNTVQRTHGTALTVKKSHQPASCSASLLFGSALFACSFKCLTNLGLPWRTYRLKHPRYCLRTLCRAETKMRLPLKHVHPAPCKNTHYPLA